MNIILIGFMGCGKSSLGKVLAKKLQFTFIDSDKMIEAEEGKSIAAIFTEKGEDYFRALEHQFIHKIKQNSNQVIAVGGGMPCYNNNMNLLNDKGVTVYLQRPAGELVNRLVHSHNKRPLLEGKTKEELYQYVQEMIQQREVFYNQATLKVDRTVGTGAKLELFIRHHFPTL